MIECPKCHLEYRGSIPDFCMECGTRLSGEYKEDAREIKIKIHEWWMAFRRNYHHVKEGHKPVLCHEEVETAIKYIIHTKSTDFSGLNHAVESLPISEWSKKYPNFYDWLKRNGFEYNPDFDKNQIKEKARTTAAQEIYDAIEVIKNDAYHTGLKIGLDKEDGVAHRDIANGLHVAQEIIAEKVDLRKK